MRFLRYICLCLLAFPILLEAQNEFNPNSTYAIPIPQRVSFCEKNVQLKRMDVRERFDRELLAVNYMHSSTLQWLKRANRYFPVIEKILAENSIPDDMKYLCCIESSLNPKAVSPSGAAGLWQFMASTGKEYGLQVDAQIDERFHIEKSTQAACQYFKKAYELYHDWFLVAASYNAGCNRISSELEKQRCNNYFDLWLSEETSRYVYRIMVAKMFMENPKAFGFQLSAEDLYMPINYRMVKVCTSINDWSAFAKKQGITYQQLKEANLWIRDSYLLNAKGKIYQVSIPQESSWYFDTDHLYIHQKNWVKDEK